MATHGDIKELTWNHPTLGSGTLFPKAAEGNTYDPGGIRTTDDANAIAGDGSMIVTKNRTRGFIEVVVENDMNIREDADKIAALAADPVPAEWTMSHINGTVWSGSGFPVGDIQPDMNAGTWTVKIAVPTLEKIVG